MHYTYAPKGVCSVQIDFDMEDNVVRNIAFTGGCNGNLKAISKLCEGMEADLIVGKLKGNQCGPRPTSCADQFARAVSAAQEAAAES